MKKKTRYYCDKCELTGDPCYNCPKKGFEITARDRAEDLKREKKLREQRSRDKYDSSDDYAGSHEPQIKKEEHNG